MESISTVLVGKNNPNVLLDVLLKVAVLQNHVHIGVGGICLIYDLISRSDFHWLVSIGILTSNVSKYVVGIVKLLIVKDIVTE